VASGKGGGGGGGGAVKAVGGVARGGARAPAPALAGHLPRAIPGAFPRPVSAPAGVSRPVAVPAVATRPLPGRAGTTAARPPPPGVRAASPGAPAPTGARPPPGERPPPGARPPPGGQPWQPGRVATREPHVTVQGGVDLEVGPSFDEELPPEPVLVEEQLAWREAPLEAPPEPPAEAPTAPEAPHAVALAPPPPLPVGARGFFQGDSLLLELTLVDRQTGRPYWRKTLVREVDPRDARQVRAAVDEALGRGGWVPVE